MKRLLFDNEIVIAYNIYDFPYDECLYDAKTVRKHDKTYYNIPAAFDIETTNDNEKEIAFMYHWQMCISEKVVFGRTWDEYFEFLNRLQKYGLGNGNILVVYVHNLSYEFQFIKDFFKWEYIFAREAHKPIVARTDNGIEFRCSYLLSNMSLYKFCQNTEGVIHYKQSNYNYNKYRTSNTIMTSKELLYCYCDVKGLCECISRLLKEDTLATIPMTNTGYVRREIRNLFKKNYKLKNQQKKLALTLETYNMCKEAFRGGDTHANAIWSNCTIDDVYSADLSSSYPAWMLLEKFPMTPFRKVDSRRFNYVYKKGYALLFEVGFTNLHHKQSYGMPYISFSKCQNMKNVIVDNGRILKADTISMTITDLDYKIILHDYIFDEMRIGKLYISDYGPLPEELKKGIIEYAEAKTKLKGDDSKVYEYLKSKNRLNGIYGMIVTDIINDTILYDGDWKTEENDGQEQLDKFYNSRNSFLTYQWGIWVTAWARYHLREMIWIIGDDLIYVDTDSVKFVDAANISKIKEVNDRIMKRIIEVGAYNIIHVDGKQSVLGLWDIEYNGEPMTFKTLGAKKYIYQVKNHRPVITIAGVAKKEGSDEIYYRARHSKLNVFDLFEDGFIFYNANHTTAKYNESTLDYTSNLYLNDGEYKLGITNTYRNLFKK